MSAGKQVSLEGFTKSRSKINFPDVGRNLLQNLCTKERKGALPELVLCPHDKSCRRRKLSASRLFIV